MSTYIIENEPQIDALASGGSMLAYDLSVKATKGVTASATGTEATPFSATVS